MGVKDKVEFQTRKMITAYGGVGSIIESIEGALIIEPIEKWLYFYKDQHCLPQNQIEDERLLKRLRYHFPNLKTLVKIPVNTRWMNFGFTNKDAFAGAKYFPEWMYCKRCKSFKRLNDWWKGWKNTLHGDSSIGERFIPPKCYICYAQARKQKKRQKYYELELEQVRFIITSPSGDIRDIPWDRWSNATKEGDTDSGKILLGERCCEDQQLKYSTSTKFADFAGITIKCANCGKRNTLAGIFGLRLKHPKESGYFKPVIRTSNSVYYSQTISGIYLPIKSSEISSQDKVKINSFQEKGLDLNAIHIFFEEKYTIDQIKSCLVENNEVAEYQTEAEFRREEYNFLLKHKGGFQHEENHLLFEHTPPGDLQKFFQNLIKVKRLRVVTVQTSYTRQEPLDRDAYLQDDESLEIKRKYTSEKGKGTEYLTAVENFGEGIFLDLDSKKANKWYDSNWEDSEFSKRIGSIQESHKKREFNTNPERFSNSKFTAKFILVHTLAHLLIKEFEFLVGYPAASLSERLYVDEDDMQALLIYAVAGSEGSYGGLISQCTPEKMNQIVNSALIRARDCASDPICYYSDGQGIANLNLAACYSCALLPETSCEEFNSYLDRRLLVDKRFGYFR
ncbi:DUF1998 domain-containing protein [bacterium]|nr:DUF1998 domain-containing protein [bacterium]